MPFTTADVTKVSRLARIAMSEEEKASFAKELGGILHWVEQLSEVDTSATGAVASVLTHPLPLRADVVTDGHQPQAVLKNAPKQDYGCFVVPKVIGES